YRRLDRVPAIGHLPTFNNVEILGVRRTIIVDKAVWVLHEADGINDKLSIFVAADGFAEPTRLWILAVLAIEIDATHLLVSLPHHPDLLRPLDEIKRLRHEQQLAWDAARPAARLGVESAMAIAHQVIVHSHLRGGPRLQVGVLGIGQPLAAS